MQRSVVVRAEICETTMKGTDRKDDPQPQQQHDNALWCRNSADAAKPDLMASWIGAKQSESAVMEERDVAIVSPPVFIYYNSDCCCD